MTCERKPVFCASHFVLETQAPEAIRLIRGFLETAAG